MIRFTADKMKSVASLLEASLFDCNVMDLYRSLSLYHQQKEPIPRRPLKDLKYNIQQQLANIGKVTTIGIDLPIFLESNHDSNTVVLICCMDALTPAPNSKHWQFFKADLMHEFGYGAPFSLLDDINLVKGSLGSNMSFFKTILQSAHIYVTDIYKIFFRLPLIKGWQNSNAIKAYTDWNEVLSGNNFHGQILAQEISIINPDVIITLGNPARDRILTINEQLNRHVQMPKSWETNLQFYQWNRTIPIIASPHISNAANSVKAKLLNQDKYKHIVSNYQNEKLAKVISEELRDKKYL